MTDVEQGMNICGTEGTRSSLRNLYSGDPCFGVTLNDCSNSHVFLASSTGLNINDTYEQEKYTPSESPVICAVVNRSGHSSPTTSHSIWTQEHRPCSSISSSCVDYISNLGYHYEETPSYIHYPHGLPATHVKSDSFKGVDSVSTMLQTINQDAKSSFTDSASAIVTICRICHMPGDESDVLISPCRCAGSMEFIHYTCLMKWLDITSKHSRKPPRCELCHFQYLRHKKFKFNQFRCPKISRQDRVLHTIFLIMMVLMIGCAVATVMCFLSDKGQISKFPRNKVDLTTEEIITLSCGVLFFVSFFVAMSVQIKAKHTVYQLFLKFIMQNMEWEIDEYDKRKDALYLEKLHKSSYKGPPAYV